MYESTGMDDLSCGREIGSETERRFSPIRTFLRCYKLREIERSRVERGGSKASSTNRPKSWREVFQRSSSNVEGAQRVPVAEDPSASRLRSPQKACMSDGDPQLFPHALRWENCSGDDISSRSLAPCLPRSWTRSRYHLPPSVRLGEPWSRLKGHRVAGAVIKACITLPKLHICAVKRGLKRVLGFHEPLYFRYSQPFSFPQGEGVWERCVIHLTMPGIRPGVGAHVPLPATPHALPL